MEEENLNEINETNINQNNHNSLCYFIFDIHVLDMELMRYSKIFRIRLGSRLLAMKVNIWNSELHTYYGITNETSDGYYVPFWDFIEDITVNDIWNTLKDAQYNYGLSDIHIIQTAPKPSFRAVAYDKMDWREYIALLAETDFLDPSYLRHTVMRGRAVIRVSQKPSTENKLALSVKQDSLLRKKSIDHATFFGWLYGIPLGTWSLKMIEPPKKLNLRASKYESFR